MGWFDGILSDVGDFITGAADDIGGFISDAADDVGDWFSTGTDVADTAANTGFDWGDVAGTALSVGGSLLGNHMATNANAAAAERMAAAYRQAEAARRAAHNRGLADRKQYYDAILQRGEPAMAYLQRIVADDPSKLTPWQQTGLDDTRRGMRNSLAASGLRGAGRAQTAAFRDGEQRYRNNAYAANQARADTAAQILGGQGFDALRSQGDTAYGSQVALGNAGASALYNTGRQYAGANLASARNNADTVGAITGALRDQVEKQGRDSRYRQRSMEAV